MMRFGVLGALIVLGGCGGGGTTGTNYSDPPPMAEIVATPSPKASATPIVAEEAAEPVANDLPAADDNTVVANGVDTGEN